MEATVITALVGLVGSILAAVLTYRATKAREREAEWRKEKLAYYKAFIESLSGIVRGDATEEGHRLFAKATNNLLLFAPQSVVHAVNAFRIEISLSNQNRTPAKHDSLLAALLLAIRSDIGVHPKDDPKTFAPLLWSSGTEKLPSKDSPFP